MRNSALSPDVPEPSGSGHLAIVGGGPSIRFHVERLKNWGGDIWAINGAYGWCQANGIKAVFMSVDPLPSLAVLAKGADAVLAEHCDPKVFYVVRSCTKAKGPFHGPSSAVAGALMAINAGYTKVTYFGCESSFGKTTHAYMDDDVPDMVRVECGGKEYLTELEYLLQAESLAAIIRTAPHVFSEQSDGLLSAMVTNPDHEIVAVSKRIMERLRTDCTCPLGICIEDRHGRRQLYRCKEAA